MPQRTCTIDGCDRPVKGHGYCNKHYQRWRAHGDPLYTQVCGERSPRQPQSPWCSVDGCDVESFAKSMCKSHYGRWRYATNSRVRERRAETTRKWTEQNAERVAAYQREWSRENFVRLNAMAAARRSADPGIAQTYNNRRRARMESAEVNDLTTSEWSGIVDAYGGRCAYCGVRPRRIEMDHVVPLSRGGNHTASNVVPACRSCNAQKSDGDAPPFVITPTLTA